MKVKLARNLAAVGVVSLLHAAPFAQSLHSTRGNAAPTEIVTPRQVLDRALVHLKALDDDRYSEKKLAVHHDLLDALRESPKLVTAVPELLRANDHASNSLIHALEDIGTARAQKALATISSDLGQQHESRLRAVMGLGAVEVPTPSTFASLAAVAGQRLDPEAVELSNTALLSLGAAGSRLRFDSELYRTLARGLVNGLFQSPDPNLRAMTLKAIGNLHDPSLGPVVRDHLYDERAPVRAAAAHALGMMRDVASRELLAALLPSEPRGAVRAAIVHSLRKLPANDFSLRSINDYVVVEPSPYARATMVRYLVDHFHELDEARGTLLELLATDPSQQVRILASYALRH